MSSTASTSATTAAATPRASLACIPCRDRHVKCGAEQPRCERCAVAGKACFYTKSRRGGLDRATLAARRKRRAEAEAAAAAAAAEAANVAQSPKAPRPGLELPDMAVGNDSALSTAGLGQQQQQQQQHQQSPASLEPADQQSLFGLLDPFLFDNMETATDTAYAYTGTSESPAPDASLDLYYLRFHRLHPFVVPRARLDQLLADPARAAEVNPLVSAMRHVGSLYARPQQQQQQLLELARMDDAAPGPFLVQCRLLLSIALYWTTDPAEARALLNSAVGLAVDLGMNKAEFATACAADDPVLAESWRRTWWQLMILDACIAATDRVLVFWVCTIENTVGLPCEEDEYESMIIPPTKTIEDMDSRELDADSPVFSSFAYLIDAYRSAADALAAIPSPTDPSGSARVLHEIDAVLDAWLLLLPESKRDALAASGDAVVDELMFQAQMTINTVVLTVHRPYSRILFDPAEGLSTCVVYPSPHPAARESLIIHTTRCLRAIEAQVRLLTLPAAAAARGRGPGAGFDRSPFVVCQLATGAVPLLAACRSVLTGPRVAVARSQLRLVIACLKALAEVWPRVSRYVRELQELARLMLRPAASVGVGAAALLYNNNNSGSSSSNGNGGSSRSTATLTPAPPTPPPPPLADVGVGDWLVSDVAAAITAFPMQNTVLWSGSENLLPSGCDLSMWST
ncbi:hypothetical protein RB595_006263 [Gaeumannomyces hyphopodioides]